MANSNQTKKKSTEPKANTAAKAETPKTEEDEKYSLLQAQIKELQNQLAQAKAPQIIQVSGDTEKIVLRFQADVADDNVAVFGPNGLYGQVTGKTGTVTVPKSDWSRFYDGPVRRMLENRRLIILSGMSADELDRYHCAYKPGEILDERAFDRLLDLGNELLDIYPALCQQHQEMISGRFLEAWNADDPRAKNRELITKLNELSKTEAHKKGLFYPILEAMNQADAEG